VGAGATKREPDGRCAGFGDNALGAQEADFIGATRGAARNDPMTAKTSADPPPLAALPSGPRSTGFGTTTLLDTLPASDAAAHTPASAFDVCHVGVVLRTLLFVEGVTAVGVLFTVPGFGAWLTRLAAASAVALPGVLMWLVAACLLKRPLSELPVTGRWIAAIALGALCAVGPAALLLPLGLDLLGAHPLLAPALAGASMAGAVYGWLQLRAQALLPADTTARLAELQSRIRPHFLFNTLNTALALVRVDPARAEGVLEDLAELFRVALTDIGESVTLGEEVELAQRYLAIEQVRFGQRMKVSWELDPDASGARVPPLILQPLVENAVRHGVEPAADGGSIRIRTRVRLGRALVTIANSVPVAPSQPGNGMALQNVRERLHLMHDMAAQFETRREEGTFRVQLVVPL
jgi:two-component system, LytTR family, sensor histidine kinase AlgZ